MSRPTGQRARDSRRRAVTTWVVAVGAYLVVTAAEVGDRGTNVRLLLVVLAGAAAAALLASAARRSHRTSTRRGGLLERLAVAPGPAPAGAGPRDLQRVDSAVRGALGSGAARHRFVRSQLVPIVAARLGDTGPVDAADPAADAADTLRRLRDRLGPLDPHREAVWDMMGRPAGSAHHDPGLDLDELAAIIDELERL